MKKSYLWALSLFTLILPACSSNDEPDPDPVIDPVEEATGVTAVLLIDNSVFEDMPKTDNAAPKYVVRVYNEDMSEIVAESRKLDELFDAELPNGNYHLLAWADYTTSNSPVDQYFNIDDFSKVSLKDKSNYSGSNPDKMAFFASEDFTIADNVVSLTPVLKPQLGQFRIIATDTPDYTVGKVVVTYLTALPAEYDVFKGELSGTMENVSFTADALSNCVCFDNIFATADELPISIKIEVYDTDGTLKACRESIDFPVVKGGITKMSTQLYTVKPTGSEPDPTPGEGDDDKPGGGIGIDEGFDETYTIVI